MENIALNRLLGDGYDNICPPDECSNCPFSKVDPTREEPNPADPDEGYYLCGLIGEEETIKRQSKSNSKCVWGEDPICEIEDWKRKARVELKELMQ